MAFTRCIHYRRATREIWILFKNSLPLLLCLVFSLCFAPRLSPCPNAKTEDIPLSCHVIEFQALSFFHLVIMAVGSREKQNAMIGFRLRDLACATNAEKSSSASTVSLLPQSLKQGGFRPSRAAAAIVETRLLVLTPLDRLPPSQLLASTPFNTQIISPNCFSPA